MTARALVRLPQGPPLVPGPQEGPELGEPLVEGRQASTARVDEGRRATRENGGVPAVVGLRLGRFGAQQDEDLDDMLHEDGVVGDEVLRRQHHQARLGIASQNPVSREQDRRHGHHDRSPGRDTHTHPFEGLA
jgi:hypothetical protein